MQTRSTLVLLIAALAFGAWVYFGEVRGSARRSESEKAARRLLDTPAAELTSLELITTAGEKARLERRPEGWRLVEPLDFGVDSFTVDRLVEAVAALESASEIPDPPADLGIFGLGDRAPRIAAAAGTAAPVEIRLGAPTPVGSARYVQVSSRPGRLFTVGTAGISPLEPASLVDLRDKRLIHVERDAVREVRVERSAESKTIHATRGEDGWKLVEPIAARADGERIERLIGDLELARASSFVDAPGAPASYGLEPPSLEIELGAGQTSERIALGKAGEKAYARIPGTASLLEIPVRIVDGVAREVFEYRYKRVLRLDGEAVARLEIAFPREQASYRFAREESTWKPEDPGLQVESLELADLVFAIESLDATGLEEGEIDLVRLGLATPRVRVTARAASGAELGWLELGDPDPQRGLAARSSAGSEIWRVENNLGEDVPLGLDAFRTRFAKPAQAETAQTPPATGQESPPAPPGPAP